MYGSGGGGGGRNNNRVNILMLLMLVKQLQDLVFSRIDLLLARVSGSGPC